MFSYVVVYLKRPQKYIIIRENWIQDLSNAKLKNNGRNTNQDFLVFWSGTNDVANFDQPPNFNALLNHIYVPTTEEGFCYIGRVIRFFGKKKFNIYYRFNFIFEN